MTNGTPAQGWYQDPRDPSLVRWWDGAGWTGHTQPMPGAGPAEPAQSAGDEAWAPKPQPEAGGEQEAAGQAHDGGGWGPGEPAGEGEWNTTVPPAPVPAGIAGDSPLAQANVFPTADAVDPITGMPVGTEDEGQAAAASARKRRIAVLVAVAVLVGLAIVGMLIFFLRTASNNAGIVTPSTAPPSSGAVAPACADLAGALTADDLDDEVVQRLESVASGTDLEENQSYFRQLAKDIKPVMQQFQDECETAVSAGEAPEVYRTFITTFDVAVADGAAVANSALDQGGQVSPEDAARLRAEAAKLEASANAIASGTPEVEASPSVSPSPSTSPTVRASATATATSGTTGRPSGATDIENLFPSGATGTGSTGE